MHPIIRTLTLAVVLGAAAPARAQEAEPVNPDPPPLDDRDADGVTDAGDACPDVAEDRDGHDDADGCPERGARIRRDDIEVLDPIWFEVGKAELRLESKPSLALTAKLLGKHREIRLIEVQCHTDARGSDAWNLTLSQQRADAVRAELIAAGVKPARVRAVGFGETRPIDSNATEAGRARNRRVELRIIKRGR